ncbi:hypothetical protein SELMODRAFT_71785, partial [Selaginella moellendorffii]
LIRMYGKCGSVEESEKIFASLRDPNDFSWNSMLLTFAQNGRLIEAKKTFERMDGKNVTPDQIAFTSILAACSHAGFVEQCCALFESMVVDHGVEATREHYSCVVDMLCRSGRLGDAEGLIEAMPVAADEISWGSLLAACRIDRDVQRGSRVARSVLGMDGSASPYLLLGSLLGK